MGRTNFPAASVWLVGAVVIATALAAPALATTTVQPSESSGQTTATPAAQVGATCEYDDLYDEAIGSVVLVSRSGGEGSGFVYGDAGGNGSSYVLTNQHVVGEASTVTVQFRDGEYQDATVVGRDAYADLAVVRVDETPDYADPLPVANGTPEPGQDVAALGSPFGLRGTVTHGIVSGVNRSMPTDRGFAVPGVVQTDTAINPGNSGGPLLACDGTVVGVNTAGIQAAVAENVGFAISAPLIKRVAPALVDGDEVDWPYLGVSTVDVSPAIAEDRGLETANGVVVVDTVEGGPAEGVLRPSDEVRTPGGQAVPAGGDVVLAIDGRPVETGEDLSSYLATEAGVGETVTLDVRRDGERRQVNVTLGERPPQRGVPGG